jgi:hypothetical protein
MLTTLAIDGTKMLGLIPKTLATIIDEIDVANVGCILSDVARLPLHGAKLCFTGLITRAFSSLAMDGAAKWRSTGEQFFVYREIERKGIGTNLINLWGGENSRDQKLAKKIGEYKKYSHLSWWMGNGIDPNANANGAANRDDQNVTQPEDIEDGHRDDDINNGNDDGVINNDNNLDSPEVIREDLTATVTQLGMSTDQRTTNEPSTSTVLASAEKKAEENQSKDSTEINARNNVSVDLNRTKKNAAAEHRDRVTRHCLKQLTETEQKRLLDAMPSNTVLDLDYAKNDSDVRGGTTLQKTNKESALVKAVAPESQFKVRIVTLMQGADDLQEDQKVPKNFVLKTNNNRNSVSSTPRQEKIKIKH